MTDRITDEKLILTEETAAAQTAGRIPDESARGHEAPVFGVRSKMSDAYDSESLSRLLSHFSEADLERQSDRLASLYDEPEEPDFCEIDYEDSAQKEPVTEPAEEQDLGSAEIEGPDKEQPAEGSVELPETTAPVIEEPPVEEPEITEPEPVEEAAAEPETTELAAEPETTEQAAEPDFILTEGPKLSWYRMLPMILSAAVVPLIAQLKTYTLPLGGYFWTTLTDDSPIYDYYSWYKMIAVLGIAALCVIVLAVDVIRRIERFRMSYVYVPAAVFAITALASYAADPSKEFTLFGWPGRMEGTLTLIAYMIILCYTVPSLRTARRARAVAGAFCISLTVFTVIGALQYAGYDPLATQTGLKIMGAFEGVAEALPGLTPSAVHQTFADPSASAAFLCLGLPVAALLYTQSDYRGRWTRWFKAPLILVLIWLCLVNIAGLKSAVIIPGLAAAAIAGIVVFHRNIKYWTKPILLMLASLALVVTVTYKSWMPDLQRLLPSLFPAEETETAADERPGLASVTTDEDSVTFVLKGSNMVLELKTGVESGSIVNVTPLNGLGQSLTLSDSGEPGVYLIEEEPYHSVFRLCIIKRNNALALRVSMPQKDWDFVSEDGEIRYVSQTGRTVRLYEPERSGLLKDQGFADCAAAVWNTSLPMLKGQWITGRGADSFCLYYPHMDYAAAYTAGLDAPPSAEGPRSSLINTAFGTGWLSAAALAAIYLVYIAQCVIIYWRRKLSHPLAYAGAGIFLGTAGFLAAALVSDTSVCSMPSFLTLLGTGIAINRILKGGK